MNGNGSTPKVIEWATMPDWLSTEEAAQLSGFHPEYIRRLAKAGKIGAEKKGRDWWIDRDMLKTYLDEMDALGPKKFDPRGHESGEKPG
jgi:excisionase family DNA binding protein